MKRMYYIVYISTSVKLMTENELKEILTISRKNNAEKDITGILLYCEGTFIQMLEGDKDRVEETYHNLEFDRRHKNLIKLIIGDSENRIFPDWSMGFAIPDKSVFSQIEGYADPAQPDFLDSNEQSPAITVLKTFAENNRIS